MRIHFVFIFYFLTASLTAQVSFSYKVASSYDDGYSCSEYLIPNIEATNLLLGECFVQNTTTTIPSSSAVRFTGLNLEKGGIIDSAFIQFSAASGNFITYPIRIYGELNNNAPALDYTPLNIEERARTVNSVNWLINGVWSRDYRGDLLRTPDLSIVVNEIVNLDHWRKEDNSIMFFLENGVDTLPDQQIHLHAYASEIFPLQEEYLPELIIYTKPTFPSLADNSWATIFPNPGRGSDSYVFMDIEVENQISLRVYDVSGRLLLSQSNHFSAGEHRILVDNIMDEYPSGLYFFKIEGYNMPIQNLPWVCIR